MTTTLLVRLQLGNFVAWHGPSMSTCFLPVSSPHSVQWRRKKTTPKNQIRYWMWESSIFNTASRAFLVVLNIELEILFLFLTVTSAHWPDCRATGFCPFFSIWWNSYFKSKDFAVSFSEGPLEGGHCHVFLLKYGVFSLTNVSYWGQIKLVFYLLMFFGHVAQWKERKCW